MSDGHCCIFHPSLIICQFFLDSLGPDKSDFNTLLIILPFQFAKTLLKE